MKYYLLATGLLSVLVTLTLSLTIPRLYAQQPWMNKYQTPSQRAHELLHAMTLDDEIQMLHGYQDTTHYRYIPGIPRLHIPDLYFTNGPAGVGPGNVNQLPATELASPLALAATWDPNLGYKYGQVIGSEARAQGYNILEGPDVDIMRDPRNGRTFEAFGEDPYLTSEMATGTIRGIQGQGVIANVKHFLANNQETNRSSINEKISDRALHEIYLPPYEKAIQDGQVGAVMAAYNSVNGEHMTENTNMLTNVLRKEFGFTGFIDSDFGATHSTVAALNNGLDMELPTGSFFTRAKIEQALSSGGITRKIVDQHVLDILETLFRFGLFDTPRKATDAIPIDSDGTVERTIGDQTAVLLKNNGVLPISQSISSVAMIGPFAKQMITAGGGSSHVLPYYTVSPIDAMHPALSQASISYSDGKSIEEAVTAAKASDVAIIFAGYYESEGSDLRTISLDRSQNTLISAVAKANSRTIVVLNTGGPVVMPWIDEVSGVLEAWYPGEEAGNVVADLLLGRVNPSGKLPVTFPRHMSDLPAASPMQFPGVNHVAEYSEGIYVGYRHFEHAHVQPLFPFGYGLSYTSFALSDLSVGTTNSEFIIRARVKNVGKVTGADVIQLYVGYPLASGEPPKVLKGFNKVELSPGDSSVVSFTLRQRDLDRWGTSGWETDAGTYRIMIGDSSVDLPMWSTVNIPHSIVWGK